MITPEARGPDQEYEGLGAADVFEAWAEIASLYPLNPAYTDITGYSMGGIGTFKLGAQFPDLFARAQPTVGFETNNDVLASLRNLPVLMWNASADELVNASDYAQTAAEAGQPRLSLRARRLPAVRELAVQPAVPEPPDARRSTTSSRRRPRSSARPRST